MVNGPHSFDRSNLRQAILDAPSQFEVGFDLAANIKLEGDFKRAVFYGEGGSAFPVSLVEIIVRDAALKNGKLPVSIFQNYSYSLTQEASEDALNIFCSYSGNTEETLTTLAAAIAKKLPVIGMASGGKLEEICKESRIPFVKLPLPYEGFQPRMGSGYFVGGILQILKNHGLSGDLKEEIINAVSGFEAKMGSFEEQGLTLANRIAGKTPVVWASQKYKDLARVWTIKFNEHAKNPAFWNFFSELNHNLMIGFTNFGDRYFAIMLKDPSDELKNLKRYDTTAGIVGEHGLESAILELAGNSVFEKIFNSIYLADFTAYYLAEKNGVDPTPVAMVEEFKKRLVS